MNKRGVFSAAGICIVFLLLVMLGLMDHPATVHGQTNPGVHTLQVTIGASVTSISTTSLPVHQVMFQNNSTHVMRLGDSLTTASRGAQLAAGSPGGSINAGTFQAQQTNLNQWFVAGTQNDVVDVIFID